MDVSDRRLQVLLTLEAKIAADFSLVRAIFAFAGFGSALKHPCGCFKSIKKTPRRAAKRSPLRTAAAGALPAAA